MHATQQRSVVIIEDDADIIELVATVLEQSGYRVSATGDSREGVDLVRRAQPDLVLCDIAMPEMDGYAVVRALQSDPATRRFPVVFLTSRHEFVDRVRAFRFGVVDYIAKPVTPQTLMSRIDSIVGGLKGRSGALEGNAPILLEEVRKDGLHEHIVDRDPPRLADQLPLPDFSEVPPALRDIVIADDNEDFRSSLVEVFGRCAFQVREAEDGMDAVRKVLEKPPSVLLVDVRMPVLDGFEVCRRLRSCALTRHLPIVFLSGFDDVGERAAGLEAGANEFLSKETPLRELLLRVQLLLQRYKQPVKEGEITLHGRLELLGAPGLLQVCHLTALTGTLTANAGSQAVSMGFDHGQLLSADSELSKGREAVFDFVAWDQGSFAFAGGAPYAGTPIREPVDELLLEGCRRIDLGNHEREDRPVSGMTTP